MSNLLQVLPAWLLLILLPRHAPNFSWQLAIKHQSSLLLILKASCPTCRWKVTQGFATITAVAFSLIYTLLFITIFLQQDSTFQFSDFFSLEVWLMQHIAACSVA